MTNPTADGFRALASSKRLLQLAAPFKGAPPLDGRVGEPKLNGWRLLAFRDTDTVRLYVRSGANYTGRLPHVEAEILARFPAGTWLDGEAAPLDANGEPTGSWGAVQSAMTRHRVSPDSLNVVFVVFDVLAIGGNDARSLPLSSRRGLLERAFSGAPFSYLRLVEQVPASEAAHVAWRAAGYEGSIIKNLAAPYASGRKGAGWTKWKPQETTDVVVIDFEPGKGGITGLVGAIVFGAYVNGTLTRLGKCSGFDMRTRHAMTEQPQDYIGRVFELASFDPNKEGGDAISPQWKRWRDDRDAESCVA